MALGAPTASCAPRAEVPSCNMRQSSVGVGIPRQVRAFATSAVAVAVCWAVACEDAGGVGTVVDAGAAGTSANAGAAGASPVGGSGGSAGDAGGPEFFDAGDVDASAGGHVNDAGREPTSPATLDAGAPDADVVTSCSRDSGCPLTQLCEEVCALHAQGARRLGRCSYSFDEEGCLSYCLADVDWGQCEAAQRAALECLVVSERAICHYDDADPEHECYSPHLFYLNCSQGP